jgi:hypothetical protein
MTAKRVKSEPDQIIKAERAKVDKTHAATLATLLGDHEQAEARQAKALVPRPTTTPAPVTADPVQDYLDAFTVPTIPGTQFRFNGKDAKYVLLNADLLPLEETDKFVFLADMIWGGWIKFARDGETPPTRIQGLLTDGFRLPPRDTIGDTDESKWEIGLSGKAEDPWRHQLVILLQKIGADELYSFIATNPTSRGAVTDLINHCQRRKRSGKNDYPIVKLGTRSFPRREPPKVKVWCPHFTIVGHQPKDAVIDPSNASLSADLNDAVNF